METEAERRVYTNIRDVFDQACEISAPFFDPKQTWTGKPMLVMADRRLRAEYPEMAPQDFSVLMSAVIQFYTVRNK